MQLPGAGGDTTGGNREFVAPLARAAAAVGIDCLFMEIHEDPCQAKSDGPNSLDFAMADAVLRDVLAIRRALGSRERAPQLAARAQKIRLLLLDVDGVLTDGRLYYTAEGEAMKAFDVKDGHGIVLHPR